MKYSTMIAVINDAKRLPEAIASVAGCDDVVVVIDDRTTDNSAEVAAQAGAQVFHRKFDGFAKQKNFGIDKCQHDWVLVLDSDERLSDQLRNAINNAAPEPDVAAYEFAWRNQLGKAWLAHGGLYPDRHTRLFDRRRARYGKRQIHETLDISGQTEQLSGDVIHLTYTNARNYLAKVQKYAPLEAETTNDRPRLRSVAGEFISRYIRQSGWRDGYAGLVSASLLAYYRYIIWRKAPRP